jgi:membrane-bound lytic murein transglycosylase D
MLSLTVLLLGGCATPSPTNPENPAANAPAASAAPLAQAPAKPEPKAAETNARKVGDPSKRVAPTDHPDVWARIRAGFAMKKLDSPLVAVHERWFASNPEYIARMNERARLYLHHIVEELERRGMPTELALLPAIESAYQPYALSRARASGLWQFIAPTGQLYGLKMNWWYDGRRDVLAATQAALDYLEKLYSEFDGDWHLALAAYNAGEGKIGRMMAYNQQRGKPTEYVHLKLKRETVNYVPKLQAIINIVSNPEKYGITLAHIPNKPYFAKVDTGSQIDLGVVAKMIDVPITDLQVINPGYSRWATAPDGPHHLLVPADKKEALIEGLSKLPANERIQYRHHAVARGDSLHEIARRYGVTIEALRTANNLHSNLLRAGQDLLIPVSTRNLNPVVYAQPARNPQVVPVAARHPNQPQIHLVRNGDTLWSIARRYGVTVPKLREWNLIDVDGTLRMGQRLRIWPNGQPGSSS